MYVPLREANFLPRSPLSPTLPPPPSPLENFQFFQSSTEDDSIIRARNSIRKEKMFEKAGFYILDYILVDKLSLFKLGIVI